MDITLTEATFLASSFTLIVGFFLSIFLLTAIANTFTFPRLRSVSQIDLASAPKVSLLVPARNEAAVIGDTIHRLLQQDYPDFEVIILDDHSDDNTGEIVQALAKSDKQLRLIKGQPLPDGWLGKNWACHQLSQQASPESQIMIFTDADVHWQPPALSALVGLMKQHRADMLTVWPTQETQTWGERLVVPMMSMVIMAYLPEIMVRLSPFTAFAAANGQCLAFCRDTYTTIGGHETVRQQITEDNALAKNTKRAGQKLVMSDGNQFISCRMYQNWADVRNGFAKNILAGHGNNPLFLLVSTFFHWALFVLPLLWFFVDVGNLMALLLILLGFSIRLISAWATHQRLQDSLVFPVSVFLMTIIAIQALYWHWHGGPRWKGRVIQMKQKSPQKTKIT